MFQLLAIEEQLAAVQAKLEETEATSRRLEHDTNVGLRARVEWCLRGYVDYEI